MEGVENKVKKSQLDRQKFYVAFIVLCLMIFLFGWGFGSTKLDADSCKDEACKSQVARLKIFIPVIFGVGASGGLMFLIKLYVQEIETQLTLEAIKKRHELEREIPSEYRYSAEMDFLSTYYQKSEYRDVPDSSYEDFCLKIRGFCDSRGGIREKTIKYIEQHHRETVEEVLNGLEKGFFESKNGAIPFWVLAKEACNYALNLKNIGKYEQWAEPFYEDVRLYLGAWLYTSIRYGFAIPIHPFVLPLRESDEEATAETDYRSLGKEARDHYHGVDSYIKAIEYIRENALSDQAILPFFPKPESRHMVHDYLGKLVQLLKDERLERALPKEDLSYVRESPDLS